LNDCHASTSSIEHVTIRIRCKDVDAYVANIVMINNLNEHVAKLEDQAKIGKNELDNDKLKYARGVFLSGRRPMIKDGLGFQRGGKENTKLKISGHELSKFVKEKGKAPIIHNVHFARADAQVSHTHVSYARASHIRHNNFHAKIAHMPKIKTSNASSGPYMSYHTFYASCVLPRKYGKVVAKYICWALAHEH
jgi:hypothetical protein